MRWRPTVVKARGPHSRPTPIDIDDPNADKEDSQFFVRMFKHDFGDPPWRRPAGKSPVGVVLTSDAWGTADLELGRTLVHDFLQTLCETKELPLWIFLVNVGVRLSLDDSPCLGFLQTLEGLGVKIYVSKTSLTHLGAETHVRVGEAVTMFDVVAALYRAEKIITL